MNKIVLGGQQFVVSEPCFRDLKLILAALSRLNNPTASDFNLVVDVQIIIAALIGEANVKKFKRFRWEAWKIPTPSTDEITTLLNLVPELCGLTRSTASPTEKSLSKSDEWDALYWRIARVTGWTFSQIDTEMTLSKLNALTEHLAEKPLVDDLVAAYVGYEYSKPRTLEDDYKDWKASQGL